MDKKRILRDVIEDISANGLRIMQYIADNLKRAEAKDVKCHSSWFPCEYCFARGTKIEVSDNVRAKNKIEQQILLVQEKINQCQNGPSSSQKIENLRSLQNELKKSMAALKRKSNILWPFSTLNAENRTRRAILEIVEKIENQEELTLDEKKGIIGRSVLLDVPNFNYVYDTPAEYLHSGCLGVTKRLLELTFSCGVNRQRITKRKLSSPSQFNKLMLDTKFFREFSRRARSLNFAVYKGQEYRNVALFYFIFVLECIEPDAKERKLWLLFAYMLRSCILPSEEFAAIYLPLVEECCAQFYKLYEALFGISNCPYNIHVFVGHLLEIRTHGPLTDTSAFKFESFYGEVRRSFVPGTPSTLKQVMKNIFLKRTLSKHVCDNSIYISNYDTALESNKLIYCYKNRQYLIYEISEINDHVVICNKVGQYPALFDETPNISWASVGVFRKEGVSSNSTEIRKSDICGKVLVVGKYLITCPINVLKEK